MKKFNYYKMFLKAYNKCPYPVRFCLNYILQKIYGQGWYGTFALKSILKTLSFISNKEYKGE